MIENLVHQIVAALPPSSGVNLGGFAQDLNHALWNEKRSFASTQVQLGSNPSRLIEVSAVVADEVKSLQEVQQALLNIWRSTAYAFFQASSCICYQEATVLRFVCVIGQEEFFVSGAITVSGGSYSQLAKEFEQRFHPLPSLQEK